MSVPSEPRPRLAVPPDTWSELENLLQELSDLLRRGGIAPSFFETLLRRTALTMSAAGGVLWHTTDSEHFQPLAALWPEEPRLRELTLAAADRSRFHPAAITAGQPQILSPQSVVEAEGATVANHTAWFVLQAPWSVEGKESGVLEFFFHPGLPPATLDGYLQFLGLVVELVADFQRRAVIGHLRQRLRFQAEILHLAASVPAPASAPAVAYHLANEIARVLPADRVSLLRRRGGRCRVLAVSGVVTPDARSSMVRKLEDLAWTASVTGEPLWMRDSPPDVEPRIETALSAYVAAAGVRQMAVLPLRSSAAERFAGGEGREPREEARSTAAPTAMLVVEHFQLDKELTEFQSDCELVQRVAAPVLTNALRQDAIPLQFIGRTVQWVLRQFGPVRRPWTVALLLLTTAVAAALWLIPMELRVACTGKLQPKFRRDVFASTDGVVRTVLTSHGAVVQAGDVLLELRNAQLEFETARTGGEMQTAQQRLATVQALRLSAVGDRGDNREKFTQLASEEEELKVQLASLTEQSRILEQRRRELSLKSPVGGQILTWDVAETLAARPVQRGQALLAVGDLHGPWEVEVEIPVEQVGHVQRARRKNERVAISFVATSDPGKELAGVLNRIALVADAETAHRQTVLAIADFDQTEAEGLRPGMTARVKIDCGERSAGFVLFHRIWETLQYWVFF